MIRGSVHDLELLVNRGDDGSQKTQERDDVGFIPWRECDAGEQSEHECVLLCDFLQRLRRFVVEVGCA